jgi:hypothetical protein|tara:strand:- start:156 stop:356 length:201 start_codon:yes stop_codon:yes gene_type:complete
VLPGEGAHLPGVLRRARRILARDRVVLELQLRERERQRGVARLKIAVLDDVALCHERVLLLRHDQL